MRKWFPKPEDNYIPGRLLRRNVWNRGKIETPTGKVWVKLPRSMHYERETIATEGAMPGALMYPGPGMHDMYHYMPRVAIPLEGRARANGSLFIPTPAYDFPRLQWEFESWKHGELQEGEIPVATPMDLHNIRNNLEGNYRQVAHIDMCEWECPLTETPWFLPIGAPELDEAGMGDGIGTEPFTGKYNGNGYVIENIAIARSGGESHLRRNPTGLFAIADNATIENVYMYEAHVFMYQHSSGTMGAIAGESIDTTIRECIVEQSYLDYYPGHVVYPPESGGGLLTGVQTGEGIIEKCAGIGVFVKMYESHHQGGLVGWMQGGEIRECFATNGKEGEPVFGPGVYNLNILPKWHYGWEYRYCGGLVGEVENAEIINSYVTGIWPRWTYPHRTYKRTPPAIGAARIGGWGEPIVTDPQPYPWHGGLVGYLGENSKIAYSYFAGILSSDTDQTIGSLYGGKEGKVQRSYQDMDISADRATAIEIFDDEYARSTERMKTWWSRTYDTYVTWDFENVWKQPRYGTK